MKVPMQPKTIEDYRDLTKVLKLKIVKQSKIIQQLEQKCRKYEQDINSATFRMTSREDVNLLATKTYDDVGDIREEQLSTLKGRSHVMRKFLRAANMFGISPQSIYRIADIYYTNCIQSDYFRTVLSKMALNLSPKQISCIIFIFDQHCLGYISKQDFQNSLHAYQIGMEQKCLPYTQQCLLRLCSLFHSERIDLNKFYDQMKIQAKAKSSGNVDLTIFQEQVKKYFQGKLQERQIMGAFNQINLEKQRSIQKKNFLYGVNSFTNRLLTEQRPKLQNSTQIPATTPVNNLKNSRSQLRIPNKTSNISIIHNTASGFFPNNQQKGIDKVLREKNIKFQDLISQISQMQIKSRLTLHQFKKCFTKLSNQITVEDIKVIFKAIDMNQKGSIHLFDAVNFSLSHFKDTNFVFKLWGKTLQVMGIKPQQFWHSEGFDDFSRVISKSQFLTIMSRQCETKPQQNWEIVWNYFDKGKGTISVQSVVDVWKKYLVQ